MSLHTLDEWGSHFVLCRSADETLPNGKVRKAKSPLSEAWQKEPPSIGEVLLHQGGGGLVGLIPGRVGIAVVDVDRGDPADLMNAWPPLAMVRTRRKGGVHLLYARPEGGLGNKVWEAHGCGGEIRCDHGYVIIWEEGKWAEAVVGVQSGDSALDHPFPDDLMAPRPRQETAVRGTRTTKARVNAQMARHALGFIDPDIDYDDWVRVGQALHDAFEGSDEGLNLWDVWSSDGEKYQLGDCTDRWPNFTLGGGISWGTIVSIAEHSGMPPRQPNLPMDPPDDLFPEDHGHSPEEPPARDPPAKPAKAKEPEELPFLELFSLHDVEADDDRNDLLEGGGIPRDSVTLIAGSGGAGKSTVLMALAIAVASGEAPDGSGLKGSDKWTWLKRNKPGFSDLPGIRLTGPVIYVSWEDTAQDLRRIANSVADDRDLSDVRVLHCETPLYDEGGVTGYGLRFERTLNHHNPLLLIIDPASNAYAGNENARPQVAAFVQWCAKLAQHVVLVAHPPKSGHAYSGSTAWESSSRAVWSLRPADGEDSGLSWHCSDSGCMSCHYKGKPRKKRQHGRGTLENPCPNSPAAGNIEEGAEEHWEWILTKANHGKRGQRFQVLLESPSSGKRPIPIEIGCK